MTEKSALIVDDSRTAQKMLQRMLEQQRLRVDTAESAESAIEYLTRHAPDVIFMDHMMPGMDGFQAVEVIKQNPETATIPIVMYTSKGGEVYVGQARALGAVGVLSKDVRPAELNQVLQRLRIVHSDTTDTKPDPAEQGEKPRASGVALTDLTVRRLARATADAIRLPDTSASLHDEIRSLRAELRQAMDASTSGLQRELSSEIELAANRVTEVQLDGQRRQGSRRRWASVAGLFGALIGGLITVAFMGADNHSPTTSEADASPVNGDELAVLREENQQLRLQLETAGAPVDDQAWIAAVSWAFNNYPGDDYREVPLGDEQLQRITGLVENLDAAGYRGDVALDVHIGDYCLQRQDSGALLPPAASEALSSCTQLGFGVQESELIAGRQSIAFANFIASSPLLESSGIDVTLNPIGNREPRVAYPPPESVETVGAWNRYARQNQRIEIRLIPADSSAAH